MSKPTKQSLPESSVREVDLKDTKTVVAPNDGYEVYSWRDGPANSSIAPSQVHLLIPLPVADAKLALRLKSPRALDELVGLLLEYRQRVWGNDAPKG